MRGFLLILLLFLSAAPLHAGEEALTQVEDEDLHHVLSSFSVLHEESDPDRLPTILRLIEVPDRFDDCAELVEASDIPSYIREDGCPRRNLYLTLTNWDYGATRSSFHLGAAADWRLVDLQVERGGVDDWIARLQLEATRVADGQLTRENLEFRLSGRSEAYAVELVSGEMSPARGEARLENVSAECALAIASAVQDFRSYLLAERGLPSPQETLGAYLESFESVLCWEAAEGLRVYFHAGAHVLDGGVDYLLDSTNFQILERHFEP